MLSNRSIPNVTVIPVLLYEDVKAAASWLCRAFGFTERLRIGGHRIQLNVGDGALVVAERPASSAPPAAHSIMVRITHLDRHHAHALAAGAQIVRPPADHPYGERQYSAVDPGGHSWTFTETIADSDPADWGGELVNR